MGFNHTREQRHNRKPARSRPGAPFTPEITPEEDFEERVRSKPMSDAPAAQPTSSEYISQGRDHFRVVTTPKDNDDMWEQVWSAVRCTKGHRHKHASQWPSIDILGPGGFSVPYEIREIPGKGRAIFSLARIPRGRLIWYAGRVVSFSTEKQFRAFLHCVPGQFRRAVVTWSWVSPASPSSGDSSGWVVKVALDDGALVNHSGKPNMGEHHMCSSLDDCIVKPSRCFRNSYALRDIEIGEEILDDYDQYDVEVSSHSTWMDKIEKEYNVTEDFRPKSTRML